MKKILLYLALLAALAACKGDEKAKDAETIAPAAEESIKSSSIDGFVEKSFAILDKKFQDTPVTKWIFDGETQKSGDDSSAEFRLPKRELKIGDVSQEEYMVSFHFPENTVKASALKDDKALFSSQIDLSQYSLPDIKYNQDDVDISISASFAGISDIKDIYDFVSQRRLSSETVSKDLAINYAYAFDVDGEKQSVEAQYMAAETKDTYVMTPGETTSDFTYTSFIPHMKIEQKQVMPIEDLPLQISSSSNWVNHELHIDWKALGNAWFDMDYFTACFNRLVSFKDEDEMLKGANCFWRVLKDTPLGEMKLLGQMPQTTTEYKIDLTSLKDVSNLKEIVTALNQDSLDFTIQTDMDIKADIMEKEGLINLSVVETINNIDLSHNIDKEALKTAAGEDAAMVDIFFDMMSQFAVKDMELELGGQLKRSSLQAIEDISDESAWNNFDLGQSGFHYRLYLMTAQGFIEAEVIWNANKDNLIAKNITEEDFLTGEIILKIQNFDNFAAAIAQVVPQAQFIAAMIKGFGEASQDDASVLIFKLAMSEDGQPLINGTALPFM